ALEYYQSNQQRFLAGMTDLLKIPSISTLPEHRSDVRRACESLADELRAMGMQQVNIIEGKGNQNPLVYAEWKGAPGKPTLLLYGHYDVQPPDPLEEWKSPPFEPAIRDGLLWARGAADNKGNHMVTVKAVEHLVAAGGAPVNIRFLIEGEEEITGPSLPAFLRQKGKDLKTDAVLIWDGGMDEDGNPTLATALRGLLYTELHAKGAAVDL